MLRQRTALENTTEQTDKTRQYRTGIIIPASNASNASGLHPPRMHRMLRECKPMADIKARRVFLPRMHPMRRGCKTIYVIYIYIYMCVADKTRQDGCSCLGCIECFGSARLWTTMKYTRRVRQDKMGETGHSTSRATAEIPASDAWISSEI